jgi:hypothetical protein
MKKYKCCGCNKPLSKCNCGDAIFTIVGYTKKEINNMLDYGTTKSGHKTIEKPVRRSAGKVEGKIMKKYKVSNPTAPMLDGPVNPYKTYGKGESGHKVAKRPVWGSAGKSKGGK